MQNDIETKNYQMDTTGKELVTDQLQKLLDLAFLNHGRLIINKGTYLVSSLFIQGDTEIHFEEGAILLATTQEDKYPILPTRVAGIEMDWYVGILNCLHASHVKITGNGVIDGNGAFWWNKYWGEDQKGGMRKVYDQKGLRWACDYDCMRPRNVLISDSTDVYIDGLTSRNSGFWNVHVLYSSNVIINNVHIESDADNSPSTDGIDIDSSSFVKVINCLTSCNDDSICIKAGRDSDGIKVNKPCHDILIENCQIRKGFGTMGSEVSGGISRVVIKNCDFIGTDCGIRMKSSYPRHGYIKKVQISNLRMENVKYLFHFFLNWNPKYSICEMPKEYKGKMLPHYKKLTEKVIDNLPLTCVSEISIENVTSSYKKDYQGINRIFTLEGYTDQPMKNLVFKNLKIDAKEYGYVKNVESFKVLESNLTYLETYNEKNDDYDNR